ncbi:MAG: hypothetical protein GWN73_41195, partial [Actinobacteria bacterium]|nr:hypothetical protein [Actinomycetota bacterium]NIS36985.1 hypothetical protein [Actinomycetota bacterium]NIU71448.1 hypothetical protein [Actinomycetota bacterium]NIV90828.1 hypothetical protein [Actinomycetota bacterium]
MKVDDELRRHFRCPKCDHRGAETRRFAATGTGLSRFLDI